MPAQVNFDWADPQRQAALELIISQWESTVQACTEGVQVARQRRLEVESGGSKTAIAQAMLDEKTSELYLAHAEIVLASLRLTRQLALQSVPQPQGAC